MTRRYLTKEECDTLVEALEHVKAGVSDDRCGICYNLGYIGGMSDEANDLLAVVDVVGIFSQGWKHHSGEGDYPVGGEQAYIFNKYERTLWLDEQLELRMDLLDYLINQVLLKGETTLVTSGEEY